MVCSGQRAAQFVGRGVDLGHGLAGDLDGVRHLSRLQRDVHSALGGNVHRHIAGHRSLESGLRHGDRVSADGQLGDRVIAVRGGLGGALQSGARRSSPSPLRRKHRARGVRHSSQNGSAEGLRRNKCRRQKQREEEEHEALAIHSSLGDVESC